MTKIGNTENSACLLA